MAITTFRLSSAPGRRPHSVTGLERSPTTDPLELAHPPALARGGKQLLPIQPQSTKPAIDTNEIANGAVTAAKMAAASLGTRLLPPVPWLRRTSSIGAVTTAKIGKQLDHSREVVLQQNRNGSARSLATSA